MGLPWIGDGRIVDRDVETWALDASRWLVDVLGGPDELARRPLVLPTEQFFERLDDEGSARARRLFQSVKALTDMAHVACELREQSETPPADLGGRLHQVFTDGAAGTFSLHGDGSAPVITYSADLLSDPRSLIATFAHELAHLRLHFIGDIAPPPGGWEVEELVTDLAAVHMGFGVFMANSAFSFGQQTDGTLYSWSARRQGYLSENALTLGLAVFLAARGESPEAAKRYLKPHLEELLDRALRRIRKRGLVDGLGGRASAG